MVFLPLPLERSDVWNGSIFIRSKTSYWNPAQLQERTERLFFFFLNPWLINRLCSCRWYLFNSFYGRGIVLGLGRQIWTKWKFFLSQRIYFKNKTLHIISDGIFLVQFGLHCKTINIFIMHFLTVCIVYETPMTLRLNHCKHCIIFLIISVYQSTSFHLVCTFYYWF